MAANHRTDEPAWEFLGWTLYFCRKPHCLGGLTISVCDLAYDRRRRRSLPAVSTPTHALGRTCKFS